MLYQDYKSKINRRVNIRKTLRRFRVPIIAAISAIVALIAAFMITKGMIFGEGLELTKIEYGNKPSFTANAVFSDVRYEFCEESGDKWSTNVPVRMGDYKMRVVSRGLFGERYSKEQSFSIVPRKIEVTVNTPTVVYGENPGVGATLAFADSVSCTEFAFEDTTKESTNVTPVKEKITIKDKDGKDVTECYTISVKPNIVNFAKRDITLTVENGEKVYDGAILQHKVWQTTSGNLVYGDRVVAVEGSFSFTVGAGTVENKAQFTVIRSTENGVVDVTHNYNITQVAGTLTVNQKPVHITPSSSEFVYDGKTHYDKKFEIDKETPLITGHSAVVEENGYPFITDVGETENLLVVEILNDEGNYVTDNYCFTFEPGAYVRVIAREVLVETVTETVTYTGKEQLFGKYDTISETKLAEGHRFQIVSQTKVTNAVDTLENTIELDIVDANGNSVKGNYVLSYKFGTVTVNKKEITVVSDDLNGIYNGRAQGAENAVYDEKELCEGHSLDITYKATVTDCSDEPVDNVFTVTIRDAAGEKVTDNYQVNEVFGKMQLSPLPIYIITDSDTKYYDGTPLKAEGFKYKDGSEEIVKGQSVKYIDAPSVTNAEEIDNIFKIEILEGESDKTFNYQINYEYGKLNIDKRPIIVTSQGFADKVYYDGEQHRNEEIISSAAEGFDFGLVENHKIVKEFLPSSYVEFATEDKDNIFNIVDIIDETSGESVRANYAPMSVFGTLHLEKRPVYLVSGSIEEGAIIYDGKSHSCENVFAPDEKDNLLPYGGLVAGHTPYGSEFNSIIDAGETENGFVPYRIEDAFGNNVIENYVVSQSYGTLRVSPRPITLISDSDTKMYDGTALENTNYQVGGEGLVDGEYLSVSEFVTLTDVVVDEYGQVIGVENSFVFDVIGGRGKKSNYVVTEENFGTLTVTKRPITLTSQSATQVYNGQELTNKVVIIGGYGAAPGQKVLFDNFAAITDVLIENEEVKGISNTFSHSFVWESGEGVPATNYDVTINFDGVLTVTKRPMTIQINSRSREYDATPFTPVPGDFAVEFASGERGLLDNHSIQMALFGSITKVGSTKIGHEAPYISEAGVDKSSNYDVTVVDGTLTVTKRSIVLVPGVKEYEYTGQTIYPTFDDAEVFHALEILTRGLGFGDTIEVTFISGERKELGTSKTIIKNPNGWVMTNQEGEDVTDCYDVIEVYTGSLTIVPRKITIEILGNYKEYYDGGTIVNSGYNVHNFLYEIGHTITIAVDGEQTNVGSSSAVLRENSVVIKDKNGADASKYYEIVGVIDGVLVVQNKRPITITSASEKFFYDGQEHKKEEYTIVDTCPTPMQRAEKELVTFKNGPMVMPGGYDNLFEVIMYVVSTGEITTDNYEITHEFGKIIIGSIDIEITTQGGEKVYDGTPLKNPGVSFNCPDMPSGLVIDVVATGEQTNAGTSKNTYKIIATIDGVDFPQEGFNIIKEELGDLTVTPVTVTIHTESAEKTYDGAPLIHNVFTSDWEEKEASKNIDLFLDTAMLTDIGKRDNTFTVVLADKEGNPVPSSNVVVSEESTTGTLKMFADVITIQSESYEFEYDGTPKGYPGHKPQEGHINYYHEIKSYGFSSFTDVGDHENTFEVVIVDGNGNSMMEFYPNIVLKPDIIKIKPRKMVIEAPTVTEKYENGKVLYAPNEIVLPNEELDELNNNLYGNVYDYGIDCDMGTIAWADTIGEVVEYRVPVEYFYITLNGQKLDPKNFEFTCEPGYLRLSDKLVEIEVFDVDGYYDGTRLEYFEDDWDVAEDQLPDGYWIELDLSGIGLDEAGSIDFEEMLDYVLSTGKLKVYRNNEFGEAEDATDLFEFRFIGNPLTLNQAELVLTAGSAKKCHDETPLTNNSYTITGGGLADGHVIKECRVSGSITDVGKEYNTITKVVIVDTKNKNEYGDPIDVTENYHITTIKGILEVFEDEQQ